VGVVYRRRQLFAQVVRLRRAERRHPSDRDIVAVRSELERDLGPVVALSLAADLLGVSRTTVRRWSLAGEVPTVMDPSGRTGVPVQALLGLHEQVEQERSSGRRSSHVIESVVVASRRRASELDARALIDREHADGDEALDRHERARLRSLAYHRALARQLRRPNVDQALHRIWQWREEGRIDPAYARRWEEVLSRPVAQVCQVLEEDSPQASDLRQNSPFAGMLSQAERRKILDQIR